ncbi:CDP-glycerol glycerophosphotransferase family protein [Leuconostoc mesenteroides]|uniref:CDP-glycerol glycerophosphotransferase family protein n=1 Tax=Leuconostoc mesenteroides TaxID=1245 RepID=UPI00107FD04C|nr:CDP-glycerol glycerophosphotransferase family protein [Leuconostoc mesenteroides]TGD34752.1 hypothetical protein EIA53_04325 [Leuconostoc mesenteroides]
MTKFFKDEKKRPIIIGFWSSQSSQQFFLQIKVAKDFLSNSFYWKLSTNTPDVSDCLLTVINCRKTSSYLIYTLACNGKKILHSTNWYIVLEYNNIHSDRPLKIEVEDTSLLMKAKLFPDGYSRRLNLSHKKVIYPSLNTSMKFGIIQRQITKFEEKNFLTKAKLMYLTVLPFLPFINQINIWLFFEKNAVSAHENAFIVYKQMRKKFPRRKVFYVITDGAKEKVDLNDDHILILGTKKYYCILFLSRVLLSSDTRYHVLGDSQFHRSLLVQKTSKKVHIFLQHGMNGIKKVPMFHNGHGQIDYLVAASEWESELFQNQWHYSKKKIIVSGLPRWDMLENNVPKLLSQKTVKILIMPTWRDQFVNMSNNDFLQTDFVLSYQDMFSNSEFIDMLHKFKAEVIFVLHPKMKQFEQILEKLFSVQVRDIDQVNEFLSDSAILITDYSSIAWDMAYINKPVIYFQYDQENFKRKYGSYLTINELPGYVSTDIDDVVSLIYTVLSSNRRLESQDSEKFFTWHDKNNTSRLITKLVTMDKKFNVHRRSYLTRKLMMQLKQRFIRHF